MVSSSASEAGHEARAVPPYFLSIVDPAGARIGEQGPLVVNEQAYGFNGLVARLRRSGDPALYRRLRELYEAFYARFHDERGGGFFDQFDLASGQAVKTKSYNSTVYVATSFLLELALLDSAHQGEYLATARELADLVATRFLDPSTGWIVENFTADWAPDWRGWQRQAVVDGNGGERIVSIGVVGHNFQAAWFLLRAAELPGTAPERAEAYLAAARSILHSMLGSAAVDWADGGVLDSFRREDGIPMWNSNKAWWQQAEAMMALTHADRIGLFADSGQRIRAARARDQILQFYFAHFIDAKNGGEFPVVAKDGSPILSENKGALGTGSYHQVELAAFMKAYARRQQSDRALGASAGEAAGQSTARDKPTWYHVPPLLSGPVAAPDFLRLPAK
jgi:mannose/cellobiose epimerase-like protein (N-acyl-D-glucosamine 2-epimerase family)